MAKTVVEIFDRYASRYDSWYERNKIIAENEVKLVKNNINWSENSGIDIGGGTGYFTRIFGCINLDSSYEMLLISKKKNIRCDPGLWRISPTKDRERFPANDTSKYL
jgi:ubiquinone/menaquinone biosynthesis C-methylase UbiE